MTETNRLQQIWLRQARPVKTRLRPDHASSSGPYVLQSKARASRTASPAHAEHRRQRDEIRVTRFLDEILKMHAAFPGPVLPPNKAPGK